MTAHPSHENVAAWFRGRLPESWRQHPARVVVDREEITVVLAPADVDLGEDDSPAARAEARAGRARAFREDTREQRMEIAREAQHRYGPKVSWGVRLGAPASDAADEAAQDAYEELWTHVAAPAMTRLRQPERMVLDTLIDSGVARSRSEALAWCVRLVGQHEGDWLADLRAAMQSVADVRAQGPAA